MTTWWMLLWGPAGQMTAEWINVCVNKVNEILKLISPGVVSWSPPLHRIPWIPCALVCLLLHPPSSWNLPSSGRSFPVERLMKCSGPGAQGEVVPCWDFSLVHWALHSHTGYITQSAAGTHTHRPGLDNIRAGWLHRNHSCVDSCPNGWYTVVHVSALLRGPPLTCCYIMLACVLFGSVWDSVVE